MPIANRQPLNVVSSSMMPKSFMPSLETAYSSLWTPMWRKPKVSTSATPDIGMLLLTDYLTRNGVTAHNNWRLLEFVNYVSPDGKMIVGSGLNSQGLVETFIITRP